MIEGTAHKFSDNINTDLISPAKYMELSREQIAAHVMEGADPDFPKKVQRGDIIVAGKNFGDGSSRETAPAAIKDCGITAVVAESFARIFYRNAINIGLPAMILPDTSQIHDGDVLRIDLNSGRIEDLTGGVSVECDSLPEQIIRLIEDGGLLSQLEKRLRAGGGVGQK